MSPFHSLDSFLFSASRAFCSPLGMFVQIQGYVICLLLAFGWAGAAYVRGREIRKMKNSMKGGNSLAFLCHNINELEHSKQAYLPRVTVVMPLKGFGEHNLHNWRSQITSLYGGPLEFLFMVDSTEDPAYHAVSRLLADFKDDVDAKVIVAGPATTCSQKIHNQLVGVERMHKDSKYVLFLDDDVRLHPGSIGALTAEMEKNPEIFIQTGYPLDLPSGSLGSYCIYEYHIICLLELAIWTLFESLSQPFSLDIIFGIQGIHKTNIQDTQGTAHYLSQNYAIWNEPRPESSTIDNEIAIP